MKLIAVFLTALLLGGCSRASMPNLEDVPPATQASVDGPASEAAQTSGKDQMLASAPGAVQLTADQRADIERSVLRGLPDPNSAAFGPMTATVSRNTSKAYIVCGLVKPATGQGDIGYQPSWRCSFLRRERRSWSALVTGGSRAVTPCAKDVPTKACRWAPECELGRDIC
jgi:hypothetical protein